MARAIKKQNSTVTLTDILCFVSGEGGAVPVQERQRQGQLDALPPGGHLHRRAAG